MRQGRAEGHQKRHDGKCWANITVCEKCAHGKYMLECGRGRRQRYEVVFGALATMEAGGAVLKEGTVCELSVLHPRCLVSTG